MRAHAHACTYAYTHVYECARMDTYAYALATLACIRTPVYVYTPVLATLALGDVDFDMRKE